MYTKPSEERKAQYLFLHTDFTQQEIADLVKVDRKTLYNWIRECNWKRARYIAMYAPPILAEQYYAQLGALNNAIALRTERPYPTKEEADIIRKLTIAVKHVEPKGRAISEDIDVFMELSHELFRKDRKLAKEIVPHLDAFIDMRLNEGSAMNAISDHMQTWREIVEFEQSVREENVRDDERKTQREAEAAEGDLHAPYTPLPGEDETEPTSTNGEFDGESETPVNSSEPLPAGTSGGNDNANLHTAENEKRGNSPYDPGKTANPGC